MQKNFASDTVNTNNDHLLQLSTAFRAAIEKCKPIDFPLVTLHNFPRGACGDASLLLAKYLQNNECGKFNYVLGEREGHSHAWLQRNSLIIDITADQFDDQETTVIVTENHFWHSQFKILRENVADFCIYDPYTISTMKRSYSIIMRQLKT